MRFRLRTRHRKAFAALASAVLLGLLQLQGSGPAAAQTNPGNPDFRFEGHGFGHGVGMSQYGAYGRAQNGESAETILKYYYRGVDVKLTGQPGNLRVRLGITGASTVVPSGGIPIRVDGTQVGTAAAGESVVVRAVNNQYQIDGKTGPIAGPGSTVRIPLTPYQPVRVGSVNGNLRYHRGEIVFRLVSPDSLQVTIEGLTMPGYLYGLGEMPSSWHIEALRAQAIAGRTYARRAVDDRRRADPNRTFDLEASTADQAYVGYEKETGADAGRWADAVNSTDGISVTYGSDANYAGDKPAETYYSSSSGGHTENSEYSRQFGSARDYLKGVPDPTDSCCGNRFASWSRVYNAQEISNALNARGLGVGTVQSLSIEGQRGVSGRVDRASIKVVGTSSTRLVPGYDFRSAINSYIPGDYGANDRDLPSTLFEIGGADPIGALDAVRQSGNNVVLEGWAIDPDVGTGPIDIHVLWTPPSGPLRSTAAVANLHRGDVGSAYPQWGPNHGFSISIAGLNGQGKYCAYAINRGAGVNLLLGCRDLNLSLQVEPFGYLDSMYLDNGRVMTSGWAMDPDTSNPIEVHVYVGNAGYALIANQSRGDVGQAYGNGSLHGFSAALPAPPGSYQACAFAINVGSGSNQLIGCRSLSLSGSPRGALDVVQRVNGGVRVAGWVLDPDTTATSDVHVYVDNAGTSIPANSPRSDVGAIYPAYGPNHGFDRVLAGNPGQNVCAYGIDRAAPGGTVNLGCRRIP